MPLECLKLNTTPKYLWTRRRAYKNMQKKTWWAAIWAISLAADQIAVLLKVGREMVWGTATVINQTPLQYGEYLASWIARKNSYGKQGPEKKTIEFLISPTKEGNLLRLRSAVKSETKISWKYVTSFSSTSENQTGFIRCCTMMWRKRRLNSS